MNVTLPLLLTAGISLIVGIAIGAIVFWALSAGNSAGKTSGNAPAAKSGGQPPAGEKMDGLTKTAVLWQDRITGRPVVEIGGKRLKAAHQLSAAQFAALSAVEEELRSWLGKPPASAGETRKLPEVERPLFGGPVDLLVRAVQADVKTPSSERSIAAQIDEILQRRLESGDEVVSRLGKKSIRLLDQPGSGLVVRVGMEEFSGIGEVPDPEIQALLRSCVEEWERTTG